MQIQGHGYLDGAIINVEAGKQNVLRFDIPMRYFPRVAVSQRFQERPHASLSVFLAKSPQRDDPVKKFAPRHFFKDEEVSLRFFVKVNKPRDHRAGREQRRRTWPQEATTESGRE